MSAQPPITIDPTDDKPQMTEGYEPLDPTTFQWQPGTTVESVARMDIAGNKMTYRLTVVKPLTFEELTRLVRDALKETGNDLFAKLFNTWFTDLQRINMLDAASFKAAADAHKAKQNGNGAK
jgi:hypothetical protein